MKTNDYTDVIKEAITEYIEEYNDDADVVITVNSYVMSEIYPAALNNVKMFDVDNELQCDEAWINRDTYGGKYAKKVEL